MAPHSSSVPTYDTAWQVPSQTSPPAQSSICPQASPDPGLAAHLPATQARPALQSRVPSHVAPTFSLGTQLPVVAFSSGAMQWLFASHSVVPPHVSPTFATFHSAQVPDELPCRTSQLATSPSPNAQSTGDEQAAPAAAGWAHVPQPPSSLQ